MTAPPLTDDDRAKLREAIDSHVYWQLADAHYRSNGDVIEPGSDDPDTAATIAEFQALAARLTDGGDSR